MVFTVYAAELMKKTRNLYDPWLLTLTIKPKIYEKTLRNYCLT